jgi:hypothetical protein
MAKTKRKPRSLAVVENHPTMEKRIEDLQAEVLRTALEAQGAADEVARLKVPLRAAEDLARWSRTIAHAAALELRRALEGRR